MTHPTHATPHAATDALPYATGFGTASLCAAMLAAMPGHTLACATFTAVALGCAWRALDLAAVDAPSGQGATLAQPRPQDDAGEAFDLAEVSTVHPGARRHHGHARGLPGHPGL